MVAKGVIQLNVGNKHALKEANAIPAKYVFLDIVKFTQNRTIEAQSDIIIALNGIVLQTLKLFNISESKRYLLPTGDGICIALLNIEIPYDIHTQVALTIIQEVHKHNERQKDQLRKFEVRIGLNVNTDNIVTDINGNLNVAGAGVNVAQRVMSLADGNQILISAAVYDTLRFREKYFNAFREYAATVKHGDQINVYQLLVKDFEGLNVEEPSMFETDDPEDVNIDKLVAYFMAHCMILKSFFKSLSVSSDDFDSAAAWLFLLAKDSYNSSTSGVHDKQTKLTFKAGSGDLRTQYQYYLKLDARVKGQLVEMFVEHHLKKASHFFVKNGFGEPDYRYITDTGFSKLAQEWPDIVSEMKLSAYRKG